MTDNHQVSGPIPADEAMVVTCGSCGTKLKVRALAVVGSNRKGKCPKCGTMLVIALPKEPVEKKDAAKEVVKDVVAEVPPPPVPQEEREAVRKVLADWKPPQQLKALTLGGTLAAAIAAAMGATAWWLIEGPHGIADMSAIKLGVVKRAGIAFGMGMAIAIAMLVASGRRGPAARTMCAMLSLLAIVSAKVAAGVGPVVLDPLFLAVALAGSTLCFIVSEPSDKSKSTPQFTSAA